MRWFMSYVRVYRDGHFHFGCSSIVGDGEHPLVKMERWNREHGERRGYEEVVLSFQQIDDDCPEVDVLSHGIS